MKKLLIILVTAALLAQAVFAIGPTKLADSTDIEVSLVNQEPDPVRPGNYVDVRFKFDNNGTGTANDLWVEFLPEFPFSLAPGEQTVRNVGSVYSRQNGGEGIIVKYRVLVDKRAVEGDNELAVRYRVDTHQWVEPDEFLIDVRTQDAIMTVSEVEVKDNRLVPGEETPVTLVLENEADSLLTNVLVTLSVGGTFIPIGSTNQKSVYQIDAGKKQRVTFNLLADPEATSGVYSVPVEITYLDEVGTRFERNGSIGLIVGDDPDISVIIDQTDIYKAGAQGEVVIKVVNKGVSDLKFANLVFGESDAIRLLSTNEIYLGNIDSDDFETADFNLYVEEGEDGKVILPLTLEYKDANNKDFADKINLELPLYSTGDAKKFGLEQGNGFVGILIVIVIVVVGLFLFRRWRKKKKK